jgi:peptidoglycan L-alanyl-D-glutamate endopeptidase CwlK
MSMTHIAVLSAIGRFIVFITKSHPRRADMPSFSPKSIQALQTCHKDLQKLFLEVVKTVDCTVIQGFRNKEDQHAAFLKGTSKLDWPKSGHNSLPSNAVDCIIYPIDWNDFKRIYFFAGFVFCTANNLFLQGQMTHQIRWGGNWAKDFDFKNNKFNDLSHWELIKD